MVEGRRIVILGMGRSGIAAARLLRRNGLAPTVSEMRPADQVAEALARLAPLGIETETGGHSAETLQRADLLVPSPGVSPEREPLRSALKRGVPVVSEIELAYSFCRSRIVAVTGSNGKTTTTHLIGALLSAAFAKVEIGGNIGRPFSEFADRLTEHDIAVLELSSFQLQLIDRFRAQVAVLLNLTPDHLDRHRDFRSYVRAKSRLWANQRGEDLLVYNADDVHVRRAVRNAPARTMAFSTARAKRSEAAVTLKGVPGAAISGSALRIDDAEREIDLSAWRLPGRHNLANAAAAVAAVQPFAVPVEIIESALSRFRPLPHRLELLEPVRGIAFVNDSKATNSDSVRCALESFDQPILLIAGGLGKEQSYTGLREPVRRRVKGLFLYGESRAKIARDLIPERAETFADLTCAFRAAVDCASPGDLVMLSPMCASFDQYADYRARGDHFKQLVEQWRRRNAPVESPFGKVEHDEAER